MTRQRAAALVLAIACVAAWWVAAARLRAPEARLPPVVGAPKPAAPAALFDFEAQRARLEAAAVPVVRGRRNPFAFGGVERDDVGRATSSARRSSTTVASAPEEAEPVPFTLVGIATRRGDDATSRVAVLSGRGQLILAARGDTVASRYQVDAVGADVVELRDTLTGKVVRLALR
jgi:hypothetical protein